VDQEVVLSGIRAQVEEKVGTSIRQVMQGKNENIRQ
jgi:hypothetical protein